MITATICEWCESALPVTIVEVVGFEGITHEVCADCVTATECVSA
jgi:hypothetical protein